MTLSDTSSLLQTALKTGRNGAYVAVGDLNQTELARAFADFQNVTYEQILEGKVTLDPSAHGLVVTGYKRSDSLPLALVMGSAEQMFEDWVADIVLEARQGNPEFPFLILGRVLPNVDVFKNQHYRFCGWWPGVSPECNQVFMLSSKGQLLNAKIILTTDDCRHHIWVIQ
jgi:hypothetical protein